jgi:hypothetical protein
MELHSNWWSPGAVLALGSLSNCRHGCGYENPGESGMKKWGLFALLALLAVLGVACNSTPSGSVAEPRPATAAIEPVRSETAARAAVPEPVNGKGQTALLASWRFGPVRSGDAGWAVAAARALLPGGVDRQQFPPVSWVPGERRPLLANNEMAGDARSTRVEWQGNTVVVTFEYHCNARFRLAKPRDEDYDYWHWWRYKARPDGEVVLVTEGGNPIPGVTAPLPLAHYVDPALGFAVDYPADWDVLPAGDDREPLGQQFQVVAFDSGIYARGQQAFSTYTLQVFAGEPAGTTVTETVEARLAIIVEPVRAGIKRRCCALLGGEPALEMSYGGTMARWGALELIALHDGREYRLQFAPYELIEGDSLADAQARAALVVFRNTFTFLPVPTPTPAPTSTPAATPTPRAPAVAAPPGLIYRGQEGMWQVGQDGRRRMLFVYKAGDAALSPDQDLVAYTGYEGADSDVWVADLTSHERHNLTGTMGRTECCPQWWPGRPGTLVLGSFGPGENKRTRKSMFFLTLVQAESSGYRVLDGEHPCIGWVAPSPDGRTIAYATKQEARLYQEGVGSEVFDPATHGLTGYGTLSLRSPSWSVDGRKLAWVAEGERRGQRRRALAVFDLAAGTARLLHPYQSSVVDDTPWPAAWSPDSRWLAYYAPASDTEEAGAWTWILAADGSEEHRIDGTEAMWSPDSRQLAVYRAEAEGEDTVWLVEAETWCAVEVALPPGARLLGWYEVAE